MEPAGTSLWLASALAAAAVGVLRFAWSRPSRSLLWNGIGWGLLLLALVAGAAIAGAWGVSIVALVAILAAFALLALAGWRSPAGRAAAANRRAGMMPEAGEAWRIGGRLTTFLIVIPGGFLAAAALALTMRGSAMLLGWGEANANVAAFFMLPIGWAVVATIILMQDRRRSQVGTLLACGIVGLPTIVTGLIA
ncbi:hypothetical protein ABC347_16260 [Sphingomonas sp. 1P06PA]|uniref:hypothetical protein n=1 Tax=Sphingomonas sp. 1P06PA TaxID=554121 RepID=UPI0039A4F3E9